MFPVVVKGRATGGPQPVLLQVLVDTGLRPFGVDPFVELMLEVRVIERTELAISLATRSRRVELDQLGISLPDVVTLAAPDVHVVHATCSADGADVPHDGLTKLLCGSVGISQDGAPTRDDSRRVPFAVDALAQRVEIDLPTFQDRASSHPLQRGVGHALQLREPGRDTELLVPLQVPLDELFVDRVFPDRVLVALDDALATSEILEPPDPLRAERI